MDLTTVWSRPEAAWYDNYYGANGYGEGGYHHFVDDQIAVNW